ncbi:outer membrane protein transport protein [Vibrio parahaemolyticus]|uniref:OmpP1/FadL family transporter n=1 Tax=Vibrio parahaemolyticus TaxID=670 RepID=UPI000358FE66|nr:outer membrane protein transport protein [Vibrio parahaemolyticus]AGQ93794.1 long-chain fatty acid transporter [Vibrio parahaemolyticus O1:Kuk str. FDA_R31]EGR0312824.1 long-chain fatty acid transporter [Vibrio parahaemolyticus]EHK0044283.1 outer membrane protein transport protein [Vibrio parahaemolyticus]EHK0045484.1 outer membrane protein transport protein [Vibrio parahaemolyticus]EIU7879341.1 outer membrane protein transport protein [Vibrio parahaemolyticus]
MKNLSKIVVASSLLTCAAAQAGGLYLYETTASDIGLASAGMAARAQDASVMAANPAGLANVSGKSFSGNLIGLYGDAQLDTMTGDAGNVIGFVPMASAFYSQQVNDKWTLGIGLYGNYGLGLEYEGLLDNHLDIPTATTQALTIQPSASYRINDHWSVGAALGIQYGMYEVETKGALNFNDEDQDTQVNGRVGVLYEATPGTRLGLSYSSETEFEFDKSNSIAPQQLIFSAYHEVNDDLAVMWNVNWQDWSEYTTTLKAADLVDVETQDTYQIALGTQYKLNEKMMWNAGFAFDTSMYESQSNGDITVPTGKAYRIGTGIDYKLDSENSIGFAFEAVLMESSETETPRLQAGFDEPALYFMSMSYNWKN